MRLRIAPMLLLAVALAARAEVTGWRTSSATYPDATPPLQWGEEARPRIRWRAKVGKSYSSPIVVGERVFVVSEPDVLLCLDRESGKLLWEKSNGFADLPAPPKGEPKPAKSNCGNTAATPTCDGKLVWAVFATGIVACCDVAGSRQWIQHFDLPQVLQFGRSASPVLAGDRLLIVLKHLFALDARSGKLLWKAEDAKETYGTPAVATVGGTEIAITPAGHAVRLTDGKVLASELGELKYATPLIRDGAAYFIGYNSRAVRLPPQASDKLEAKELWTAELEGDFFSSPVCHDGLFYTVNDFGTLYVLDAATGKTIAEKELDIPNASGKPGLLPGHIYPSIVLAGKHLFVFNNTGHALVFEPGREPRQVARNVLSEGAAGTAVFVKNCIFVRGGEHLYCIGD